MNFLHIYIIIYIYIYVHTYVLLKFLFKNGNLPTGGTFKSGFGGQAVMLVDSQQHLAVHNMHLVKSDVVPLIALICRSNVIERFDLIHDASRKNEKWRCDLEDGPLKRFGTQKLLLYFKRKKTWLVDFVFQGSLYPSLISINQLKGWEWSRCSFIVAATERFVSFEP